MDIVERINLQIEVSRQRDEWTKKAIDLLAQGKEKQGLAAARTAEALDRKVKDLELHKIG
jgi:hypothetical protein